MLGDSSLTGCDYCHVKRAVKIKLDQKRMGVHGWVYLRRTNQQREKADL